MYLDESQAKVLDALRRHPGQLFSSAKLANLASMRITLARVVLVDLERRGLVERAGYHTARYRCSDSGLAARVTTRRRPLSAPTADDAPAARPVWSPEPSRVSRTFTPGPGVYNVGRVTGDLRRVEQRDSSGWS